MIEYEAFTNALLDWYHQHKRDLPWRRTNITPYEVWISEIMLQQTQVSRVKETFYPRFLEHFPSVEELAQASWDEVYPCWKGLGYYRRGKNILKAAKMIVNQYGGEIPQNRKKLEALPGIGKYTAGAILSFAYREKVPAIDTNLLKIIQILWTGENIQKTAEKLISYAASGADWNAAMMDLATALRAKHDIKGELGKFFPVSVREKFLPLKRKPKEKKKKKRNYKLRIGVACIHRDGKYLIQTRPKGKSFEGTWEFPGGKVEKGEDFRGCVKREILEELGIEVSVRPHFHEQEHHFDKADLLLRYHRCQIQKGEPKSLEHQEWKWATLDEIDQIEFLETSLEALEVLKKIKG